MQEESPPTPRQHIAWGLALTAVALLLAFLIYTQPQNLHAPAWVAYTAAGAFFLGGLSLIAAAARASGLQNWLAVALVVALAVPGIWVAFGPGERKCIVALPFLEWSSEVICRAGFGVGALIGVGVVVLYIRHALGGRRKV